MNHPRQASSFATAATRCLGHCLSGFAGLAIAAAMPAAADPLPAAQTFVQCSADGNSAFDDTQCKVGGFPGVVSSSFSSAVLEPFPFVVAEISVPRNGVFGAGGSASAFYSFEVTGGNVGDLVPILIQTNLFTSGTSGGFALARLIVHTSVSTTPLIVEVCSDGSCDDNSTFETLSIQARSGSTTDSVILYVEAQAAATRVSDELAHADADPYIFVDPAFANASLYGIVLSAGVGNMPLAPVPEPATAVLLLVGAVLGLSWIQGGAPLWRRRRESSSAASTR